MTRLFLTIFFISFTMLGWGQQTAEQKKLEKRRAQIQKEISALKNLVSTQETKGKNVLGKIEENTAKIKLSEKLISNTSKQTRLLSDGIYTNQLEINKLNRELNVLKEDYANMVVRAYKSRSEQSRIMFILSSENFLQAYKRMQYMKQYATFRKVQGEEIRSKMTKLEQLVVTLDVQKKSKEQLLAESRDEKKNLEKDKDEQEKLIKTIQRDKKKYAGEIKKKQQEANEIERKIKRILQEAIAAANRRAASKAATPAEKKEITEAAKASPGKIVMTKEEKLVASNFKSNRGKLPWPVAEGYISLRFGKQANPFDKTIITDNNGIEITANPGASARAVFDGEVIRIEIIAGTKTVYIKHGDYVTLYSNLSSLSVGVGEKVSTKQSLGTIHTYPGSGRTIMKFYVTQNTTFTNPESWIAK